MFDNFAGGDNVKMVIRIRSLRQSAAKYLEAALPQRLYSPGRYLQPLGVPSLFTGFFQYRTRTAPNIQKTVVLPVRREPRDHFAQYVMNKIRRGKIVVVVVV